jgi:pyruvate kinase
MLSGETAKGSYPELAVAMMAETCFLAESSICYPPLFNELRMLQSKPTSTTETVAMAAVAAALEQNAGAIIVMSTSCVLHLQQKFRITQDIILTFDFILIS